MTSTRHVSAPARRLATTLLPLAALLVILVFLARTSADADLWGHLAFGRDIVRSGAVHHADPYSFTSDKPWVNHEWLAESAMWIAYAAGGAPGLVALKLALASAAGVLLLASWRRAGIAPPRRDVLLFLVALGTWPQLSTMRPQVFSIAFVAVLLVVLERVRTGERRLAWWLPLLFAAWVNTHGGWLVGAGIVVLAAACDVRRSDLSLRQRTEFLAACAAAAAATLCNPYGISMLAFLAETVRPNRGDIVEWRSVAQLPPVALALWAIPATLAVVALWRSCGQGPWGQSRSSGLSPVYRPPLFSVLVVAALAVGSFRVARLVSFFALAVGFYLVPLGWGCHAKEPNLGPEPARSPWPYGGSVLPATAVWAALVSLAVAAAGRTIHMDGPWFPEPEAAIFVKSRGLTGRMLTWFDYGEYAIWHFAPAIRVSMDGRRETVYSERVRTMNFEAYAGGARGMGAVESIDPDYVWLPNASSAVESLGVHGWHTLFRGSRSTILARTPLPPAIAAHSTTTARAFPGP